MTNETPAQAALSQAAGEWATRPRADRLARLEKTPQEVAERIEGRRYADLRGSGPDGWSATEIVCHLRDIDDLSILRFRMMLWMDDPKLPAAVRPTEPGAWAMPASQETVIDPERWAVDRQYRRSDARDALAAFTDLRADLLAVLARLQPEQWQRGGIHPSFGRMTFEDWVALLASHDVNHLTQLEGALAALDG